ncbi:hypothetical protein O9G_006185 [Rozella allomycis CSF55]|uniref:Uncharacterized protein n=1 Tax=Rozella allomycis (strain CSF55) TaxID=988480 RepID=A0A075B4T8_ROZAC|nr:hypothetical protein O9G_006185 [Rozella allomycis CSF55]|eukprot:EPZ36480.1 hypothetical protein O9G_006185 [Rozella allomycis CSF55]
MYSIVTKRLQEITPILQNHLENYEKDNANTPVKAKWSDELKRLVHDFINADVDAFLLKQNLDRFNGQDIKAISEFSLKKQAYQKVIFE